MFYGLRKKFTIENTPFKKQPRTIHAYGLPKWLQDATVYRMEPWYVAPGKTWYRLTEAIGTEHSEIHWFDPPLGYKNSGIADACGLDD